MKNSTIKLNVKKPWQVSKGHTQHRSGAGKHIPRPHKGTRGEKNRFALSEY